MLIYFETYFLFSIFLKSFFSFLPPDLKESNVTLKLTIVETVGYGDQINKEDR